MERSGRQLVAVNKPSLDPVAVVHTWSMQRSVDDLRASSEHVLYEVQLLFRLADRLRASSDGHNELPWEIEVACIESFAVHARALTEFLWSDPKGDRFPDDAFASEFFPPAQWANLRDRVQRSAIDGLSRRTGNEIAHLSYKRSTLPREERSWQELLVGPSDFSLKMSRRSLWPTISRVDYAALGPSI
jgi:hypothetical protein